MPPIFRRSALYLLARSALLVMEGSHGEAAETIELAERAVVEATELEGVAQLQREWLAKLRAALRSAP